MSIESFQEMMNDVHDMAFGGGANNSTTTRSMFDNIVHDSDFQTRALALVRKSIFRLKVDKLPIFLKLSYRQFLEISRDASNAERRRHFSVRIYADNFSKFGIASDLDAKYVQINVNKIYDVESQNSHLLWILSEISVILARGDWDDCFFWNEEEHQKYLQLLQEAESLV